MHKSLVVSALAGALVVGTFVLTRRRRGGQATGDAVLVEKRRKLRHNFLKEHIYDPPAWAKTLRSIPVSRVVLCQLPTPLYRWERFPLPSGVSGCDVEVWVKRDDETGSAVGGNKIRKLEFIMAEAKRKGFSSVITGGKVQSNHARATAVAASMLGLRCVLALRTGNSSTVPPLEGNLLINHMCGAEIHVVSDSYYESPGVGGKTVLNQVADLVRTRTGSRPYVIPIGGSDHFGIWGYIDMVEELRLQMVEGGLSSFDELVCSVGSCGTVAGIALGCYLTGVAKRVRAFTACDTPDVFYKDINALYKILGFNEKKAEDLVEIVDATGQGYHLSSEEELVDIYRVSASTGVLTDPVYSGKALHKWLSGLQGEGSTATKRRVLFVHTGGMLGLWTKSSQLAGLKHHSGESGATFQKCTLHQGIPS